MNDSLRTNVFVRFQVETIACACIYLAARALQVRRHSAAGADVPPSDEDYRTWPRQSVCLYFESYMCNMWPFLVQMATLSSWNLDCRNGC